MIYLLLSILTSTLLVIILKLFDKFNVDTFQAIVVNYWICTLTGGLIENYSTFNHVNDFTHSNWMLPALILGVSFILIFNLMGWTAQKLGLTAVSVSNKLSLVIPVTIAFIFFDEKITILKVSAILLALASVIIVTYKKNDSNTLEKISPLYLLLPLVLFLGSGFLDTIVNYAQKRLLTEADKAPFVIWLFQIAAIAGTSALIFMLVTKKKKWAWKNLIGGICLGIPNYFSLYYLVKALADSPWQSTVLFPLNNVGIVIASAVAGILIFKEKLSFLQIGGIALACIAIIMLV